MFLKDDHFFKTILYILYPPESRWGEGVESKWFYRRMQSLYKNNFTGMTNIYLLTFYFHFISTFCMNIHNFCDFRMFLADGSCLTRSTYFYVLSDRLISSIRIKSLVCSTQVVGQVKAKDKVICVVRTRVRLTVWTSQFVIMAKLYV